MAVVSISRIQIRRGRVTELPQLASGEFGWAVDTQELYIGNGAVAEGAPYVGNTKLLSEKDNLFEFANTYQYKSGSNIQTGNSVNNPVLRTLQDRLDDIVGLSAFGGTGDGSDHTEIIQRAVDQLYLNAATKSTTSARVILNIEPGEYSINDTIKVPPHATIRGAGVDKTIINAGTVTVFETVNESSTPGVYNIETDSATNQARNIEISGLTIQTATSDGIHLQSCKDSIFENLKLQGNWDFGDTLRVGAGIRLSSHSIIVPSSNNEFRNITIDNFSDGVYSDDDVQYNLWSNCSFDTLDIGVNFGSNSSPNTLGQYVGPSNNIIENCTFDNIYRQGINVIYGSYNTSKGNKFYNVGNFGGLFTNAKTSNIHFATKLNYSLGDYFNRTETLGNVNLVFENVPYVAEISGIATATLGYTYQIKLNETDPITDGDGIGFINLAAETAKTYVIDYSYVSEAAPASKSGTLEVFCDPVSRDVQITDEYQFIGDNNWEESLLFNGSLYQIGTATGHDTLIIRYTNNAPDGDIDNPLGSFTYTISTKS
jgi:hypothetical protein